MFAIETESNLMTEGVDGDYRSASGNTARREIGHTPNGNPIAMRWVLRDQAGAWVDYDQYRRDLFSRNGLRSE